MISAETLNTLYWTDQLSTVEIGARYGVAKETVRGWMKRHGIPSRSKRDAAVLSPSEWTPERIKRLKEIWYTSMTGAEMRADLGLSYTPRSVYAKAAALGLRPRQEPRVHRPRPNLQPEQRQQAQNAAARMPERSIISFLPESPRLEMEFRHLVAAVRAERGRAWTELQGVTRSQAKWAF